MTARIIPAGNIRVELEDLMLDVICFDYARSVLGDRIQAGKLRGYIEATFAANPGLAELGLIIPLFTVIRMPEFIISTEIKTVRLWD